MIDLAYGAEWERATPSERDVLSFATAVAMVLTALAHPWELLDDVTPWLADRLARAWVWVDSRIVHAHWLASFAPPRTA